MRMCNLSSFRCKLSLVGRMSIVAVRSVRPPSRCASASRAANVSPATGSTIQRSIVVSFALTYRLLYLPSDADLSPLQYSPVTICLVTDPTDEHCILVRHRGSAAGVFTCIAGFAMVGSLLFLAFLFNLPINNSLVNQSLVLMRLLSTDGE